MKLALRFKEMLRKPAVVVQFKLNTKVVNSKWKSLSKKLTVRLSDPIRRKKPFKTMRQLYASDVMAQRSTEEGFLAENAMDQVPSITNSSRSWLKS